MDSLFHLLWYIAGFVLARLAWTWVRHRGWRRKGWG